ncbi:abortive infection family protein [Roseomonas gilardii]|uniref:abortive infection family protein n=1 Tax=Roseomonas gilardii TaxID=257708 RepID=UPI0004831690|nr:abortive infection family protein [Roseomonas gilardii]SUE44293.1 Uncharacterised protein [Roseomonas gilardii subsp. rosea]
MNAGEGLFEQTDLDRATLLQNGLVAHATGGTFDGGDAAYKELRLIFAQRADTKAKLPDFIKRCSDLAQFWGWIKYEKPSYAERRQLIWGAFRPLIGYLEGLDSTPGTAPITDVLEAFDAEHVQAAWQKALDRRASDPEGAITAARTLLETVCKHVLDRAGVTYPDDADLPKLWGLAAESLKLAPSQHHEESFKVILGSCQQIVNRLGTLRNRISDAHGQGSRPVRPKPRHAELAVNLAGTMAAFLVATWQEQQGAK